MPLVLTLKAGEDFYVDDQQFMVEQIYDDTHFRICHMQTQKQYEIGHEHKVEVFPEISLRAAFDPTGRTVRVDVQAPQRMKILRGDKKRNPPAYLASQTGK